MTRTSFRSWLASIDDYDLTMWLAQYAGRQAGYYPGMRRQRLAAESVARLRGIDWRAAQPPHAIDMAGQIGDGPVTEYQIDGWLETWTSRDLEVARSRMAACHVASLIDTVLERRGVSRVAP